MTDLNLRASRIQLYGLIAAVALAIIIAIGITTGAFVLSFAVLRDLAHQAGMPVDLSWIFPAIVDGAILGATIAAVVLNKITGSAQGKKFFVWLLVSVVCISVAGNAYHAYKAAQEAARNVAAGIDIGTTPLAPVGAALIAVIPPLLVLAFTHGIGLLIKAIGNAYSEYNALVNQGVVAADAASASDDRDRVAPTSQPAPAAVPAVADVASTVADAETEAPADSEVLVPVEPEKWAIETESTAVTEPAVDAVAPVADGVAHDATADVALFEVIAPIVAHDATIASHNATPIASDADDATAATEDKPEQTIDELLTFIEQCGELTENVRKTARLKISNPSMSFAAIAEETGKVAASTALRRYQRAEEKARAAGFTVPPLPDLTDGAHDASTDVAETRELVTHR